MTTLAHSLPSHPKPIGWITPKEQLERLYRSIAEDRNFDTLCSPIAKKISTCKQIPVSIVSVATIIANYAYISPITDWYTALERLDVLSSITLVPPLPPNIFQIFMGMCPVYGGKKKTYQTHFLQLIPQEFANLRTFNACITSYGEKMYAKEKNPLRLNPHSWAFLKELSTALRPTHWILTTKHILPKTRMLSYAKQAKRVDAIREKSFVRYRVPSLKGTAIAIILHQIATGQILFRERNFLQSTFTRVRKVDEVYSDGEELRFVVGGSGSRGLLVLSSWNDTSVGMAAQRIF